MTDETPEGVVKVKRALKAEKEKTMAFDESPSLPNFASAVGNAMVIDRSIKMLEIFTKNMEAVLQAVQGSMNHTMARQEAALNFTVDRMQKTGEAVRGILSAENPAACLHLSAEYYRARVEDYARYGQQLTDMTLAAARDHIGPFEKRAEETLTEMTKAA